MELFLHSNSDTHGRVQIVVILCVKVKLSPKCNLGYYCERLGVRPPR